MNPHASLPLTELLAIIRQRPDCQVLPPAGQPALRAQHQLPYDLRAFYDFCGGVILYPHIAFPVTVLSPALVRMANPAVMCLSEQELLEDLEMSPDEASWNWYTLALNGNGDYFVIDLSAQRLGRCYDANHETYPMRGQTDIVAVTFTGFLARMLWLIETSPPPDYHWPARLMELRLGDAYE
jgi:hypothetical protein